MAVDLSELSSIEKTIEDLAQRVGRMGDAARDEHDDGPANELFAIERALTGAKRRLTRLLGGLRH